MHHANKRLRVAEELLESIVWCHHSRIGFPYEARKMNENDFEGTLVLEKLAQINRLDAFYDAIDADDFGRAKSLMKRAGLDAETIAMVLKKMADADGKH